MIAATFTECASCGDKIKLIKPRNWYRSSYWQHIAQPNVPHKPIPK